MNDPETHRAISEPTDSGKTGSEWLGMNSRRYPAALRWQALVLMLVILSVAHFAAPADLTWVHDFLFKVTYLPIVLAGLWFGLRGGMLVSLITSLVYVVHIRWQLSGHHEHAQTGFLLELVLYLLIGAVVGWLSDQQKAARNRLATANAQLQRSLESLREKTEALLAAEESLRRADRLKAAGQIALGMAHEIRNPLGGIIGAAEILANPGTDAAGRAEFAAVISRESKRLDRVITNLLDFARPAASPGEVSHLRQELEFVEKLTAGPRSKKAIRFDAAAVAPDLVLAMAPDALRQVVLNLTLNAIAAARAESPKISWQAVRGSDGVYVSITDNGLGVDASIRNRLFEPFVTTSPDGTGLGLAIIARLVGDVGGAVELERTGETGTTFTMRLPPAESGITPGNQYRDDVL